VQSYIRQLIDSGIIQLYLDIQNYNKTIDAKDFHIISHNMKRFVAFTTVLILVCQSVFASVKDDCILSLDSGFPIVNSPRCENPNGSIEVSASGTGSVTYSINGGPFVSSGLFENLVTGSYTIIMRDDNCEVPLIVDLEGEESISIGSITSEPSQCDEDTGSITVSATGLGLRYSLDDGATFQTSNVFNNLAGGFYNVIVQDANGCIEPLAITVDQGSIMIDEINVTDTDCDNTGRIQVIATGNGIQYRLIGVSGWGNRSNFNNLAPGTYFLEIRDNEGCKIRERIVIANSLNAIITPINPLCGENNGEIVINVITPGSYEYSVNGGAYQNSNTFENLPVGVYEIRIRLRGSDCILTRTVRIDEDPEITIDDLRLTKPTCNASNGRIEVDATGDNLRFFLNSPTVNRTNTTGRFPSLPQESYVLTIKNEDGCELPRNINLNDFNDIVIRSIETTPSSCSVPEGSITINAISLNP